VKSVIFIQGDKVEYFIKKSRLSRRITVSVRPGGEVRVSVPYFASVRAAENFLREKADWVLKSVAKMRSVNPGQALGKNKKEYQKFKKSAATLIKRRVEAINQFYQFPYQRISIRNQSSRWGSCSTKGNLSFNYKIALLPRKYMDYIIVHELCHLKEMNHSWRFWELVTRQIPNHKTLRKAIRQQIA
jgi:predicted metal-dependent hydrolase